MNWVQTGRRLRGASLPIVVGITAAVGGCAHLPTVNPFAAGGVNPDSTVAAEVVAASRAPGVYPRFSEIPALPTDVRPVPAWRSAVLSEWNQKRQTERQAAALNFTLANTEAWAESTRRHIPPSEMSQPTPSAADQTEAFAAAERARATPPPPPQ